MNVSFANTHKHQQGAIAMKKEGEVRNLEEVDRNNQTSYLMGQLTSLSSMHEDYIFQSNTNGN